MDPPEDLLLQLTRPSNFRVSLFESQKTAPRLEKNASFENLVSELFSVDQTDGMDIQQGFVNDSKCGEEALKSWQPPRLPSPVPMDTEQPGMSQPVSSGMTNMAQTLEYPATLQMTQEPQHPEQSEAIQSLLPGLPVFKFCRPRQLPAPLLEIVDADTVDEILSPLSSSSGTEVTQAAQTPQMETIKLQQQVALLSPPSLAHARREATVKIGGKSIDSTSSAECHEMDAMANFIQKAVAKFHHRGAAASSNGKIQVHEVVLVILIAGRRENFNRILCFCTEDGLETDDFSDNFMARDTKAMGRLWQILKGNRNAKFDTFARAMRVGREREKDYFLYLSSGKGSKKRMYRLGAKARKEFERMSRVLSDADD